jgi:hypothetical protein
MVEFGLTFVFFIFVVLATINMMLVAYNLNLAQRTSWEAARKAGVGATNDEVADVIYREFFSKMFASPFMISKPDWGNNDWILPFNQAERVQGREATVTLRYTIGFSFLAMSNIQATFPVATRLVVIAQNDEDRDGLHDQLSDNFPSDHNNNGTADGGPGHLTADDDGDGIPNYRDRGEIKWNGTAYMMRTMNAAGAWSGWASNARIATGFFAAPQIHTLSDGALFYAPAPLRKQAIPRHRDGTSGEIVIGVDLSYDLNNNGWEDKLEGIYFP